LIEDELAGGGGGAKRGFAKAAPGFVERGSRRVNGRRGDLGRRIAVELMVVAGVGLALAALGPFGSYALPFAPRALYWMGTMLAGYALIRPTVAVSRSLSDETGIAHFSARLLALSVAAVPLALLVAFASDRLGRGGGSFMLLYVQVWGIGLAMTLFMSRFLPEGAAASPAAARAPETGAPEPVRPRFLDRLPATVSPLLCLSMEDHYVRAHGPQASALILMRMRDAVAELDGLPGLQVHRSWWVAREAVERIEKDGERVRLRLVNGMTVPVARSQVGAVKAQRWGAA
jgi:hypothetical protein